MTMAALTALQTAMLGTAALAALSMIISHEMTRSALNSVWEDEAVRNFTSTFFAPAPSSNITNTTTDVPHNSTALSIVALPDESSPEELGPSPPRSFYLQTFPRTLLLVLLLCPLQYYWHIGLERLFPTRPRNVEVDYEDEKPEQTGGGGERPAVGADDVAREEEEEVVKRWIEKGRVRQSAVSWRNTLAKWVLHMSLGTLWYEMAWYVLDVSVVPGSVTTWGDLNSHIWYKFLTSFVSVKPLLFLIAFVKTPAPGRVVLGGVGGLIDEICSGALLQLAVAKLLGSSLLRDVLDFAAEFLTDAQIVPEASNNIPLHLIDEL